LELFEPLVLAPLDSIGPLATAGAILFGVEEVCELSVDGMKTEAARAESAKSGRARANSRLEVSGKCERRTRRLLMLLLIGAFT
jgi:hypothetical protein